MHETNVTSNRTNKWYSVIFVHDLQVIQQYMVEWNENYMHIQSKNCNYIRPTDWMSETKETKNE